MSERHASSLDETRAAAAAFVTLLRPGDVVVLVGGLGAGKTAFTQGAAAALGVRERVTSPTFTLAHPYATTHPTVPALIHVDLYRTGSMGELWDLGLEEELDRGAVAFVEWGDLAPDAFGRHSFTVTLTPTSDEARDLTLTTTDLSRRDAVTDWGRA
jgi:tRNA threonylcarbamoyladenosine biosynthesis protein TsaE